MRRIRFDLLLKLSVQQEEVHLIAVVKGFDLLVVRIRHLNFLDLVLGQLGEEHVRLLVFGQSAAVTIWVKSFV